MQKLLHGSKCIAILVMVLVSSFSFSGAGAGGAAAQTSSTDIPLRIMVPTEQTIENLQTRGITSLTQISPNIDPQRSFSPGPRMNLALKPERTAAGLRMANPFKTLAILVKFSDKASTVSAASFDSVLFSNTTGVNSMRNYYREVSYNQLDIVTIETNRPGVLGWQLMPQPYAYYVNGQNCLGSTYPRNCQGMTIDALKAVDSLVDFAQYDNNGDGYVDTVFIIHAGRGAETTGNSNDVWSHSWSIAGLPSGAPLKLDGVRFNSYTAEPEYNWSAGDITHGVYSHELGHAFGLPDLYDVNYTSSGVGDWSLMSGGSWNGGGAKPAHLDAWSRIYLGFTQATVVSNFEQTLSLPNVEQNGTGAIYRINTGQNANEYFLLESRYAVGADTALPAHGLLIWHVDDGLSNSNVSECRQADNYLCRGATKHFRVALEQADGLMELEYGLDEGDSGDPFPGSANNRVFNFTTNPNTSSYYASTTSRVDLYNISVSNGTASVQVSFMPTAPALLAPSTGDAVISAYPTVNWQAISFGLKYQVQIDNNSDFSSPVEDFTGAIGQLSYTAATALTDGGTYYWRVRALNSGEHAGEWSSAWNFIVNSTPVATPSLTGPANGSYTNKAMPTFSWGAVSGAVKYQIQVDNDADFSSPAVNIARTVPSYTPAAALANGTYYWRVRASDGLWGAWSAPFTLTIDTVRPALPTLASPANNAITTNARPTFDWSDAADAHHYLVVVDDSATFTTPNYTFESTTSSYTPDSALIDKAYYWRVRAVDAAGNVSGWTAAWKLRIDAVVTPVPVLLLPVDNGLTNRGAPTFSWEAATDVTRYQIQIDNNSDFSSPVITAASKTTSYVPTTALGNGVFYWHVRARATDGLWGAWSSARSLNVDRAKPAAPTLSSPANNNSTSDARPMFDWSDTTAADLARYELVLDDSATFTTPDYTFEATTSSYTPDSALIDKVYYWRVRAVDAAGNVSGWTAAWKLRIDAVVTPVPVLLLPVDNGLTNRGAPTFSWEAATDVTRYQIQIDNNSDFSSPVITAASKTTSYVPTTALGNGVFYWHVRARATDGLWGAWSSARSLNVDRAKPAAPTLVSPAKAETIAATNQPTFDWSDVADANQYEIQIDDIATFASPLVTAPVSSSTYNGTIFVNGTYYWRVRSIDLAGNIGGWTSYWKFTISYSAAPPAESTPTTLTTVEAESAHVILAGNWTAYASSSASGGGYVYSSGAADDALTMTFSGTQVDVVYVKHAALGTFGIEVDGVLLQTITSTSDETVFGARISVGYLADGDHTLRVYAVEGTIAVDALAVQAIASMTATTEPTPTVTATEETPVMQTPTATSTPQPTVLSLPLVDAFDGGLVWTTNGNWTAQAAYQGMGWFGSSATEGSSTLKAEYLIDLGAAANPQLTFWQKTALSSGDVIGVDVSTDGGINWMPLDAQIGTVSDWAARTVDLSAYQGQVIRLRFRLGVVATHETTVGWWVDELVVQDIMPATATPIPTGTPTDVPIWLTETPPVTETPQPTDESGWVLP